MSANVTLYAKWDAVRVNYTVLYWQENADDDGYSLKESEVRQGLTGALTEASASKAIRVSVQVRENWSFSRLLPGMVLR